MEMGKVRILVADDDPDIRDLYALILGEHFDLILARDGMEAWKLFEQEKPRLVLTDLNMPGMNGLELTGKIRQHEELSQTPVIILTGTTKGTDLPPGFWKIGSGANSFIEKPVTPTDLVNEVKRQLVLRAQAAGPMPAGRGYY